MNNLHWAEIVLPDEPLYDLAHALPPVDDMPAWVKGIVSVVAVTSSVTSVLLAPALVPHTGETVAAVLGIVFGGLASIVVVAVAVVGCRGVRRLVSCRRRERAARVPASAAAGPFPPVVG